jgi:hypothetical protein
VTLKGTAVTEFTINSMTEIAAIRQQATAQASDELQGGIESVAFALKQELAPLPLILRFPPPPAPDAIIMSGVKPALGVEVTRVGWLRLSQVRSEAAKAGDNLVEIGENLLVDQPARPDKSARNGSRSGDFGAIRTPEEGLRGPGLLADESRARNIDALRAAIDRKRRSWRTISVR